MNEQNEHPIEQTEQDPIAKRLEELEIQMQELDVLMEQIELKIVDYETEEQFLPEYQEKKQAFLVLEQEYKEIKKSLKKSTWDKIPIWMILYAIFQGIICFPFISSFIWVNFANKVMEMFNESLQGISASAPEFVFAILVILIVYSLPLLNILLSWILYINVVKKEHKKIFRTIWIGQGILTLAMAIWLYVSVVHNVIS